MDDEARVRPGLALGGTLRAWSGPGEVEGPISYTVLPTRPPIMAGWIV